MNCLREDIYDIVLQGWHLYEVAPSKVLHIVLETGRVVLFRLLHADVLFLEDLEIKVLAIGLVMGIRNLQPCIPTPLFTDDAY